MNIFVYFYDTFSLPNLYIIGDIKVLCNYSIILRYILTIGSQNALFYCFIENNPEMFSIILFLNQRRI